MGILGKGLNILGVVFDIWFLLTSGMWIHWGALYIAYLIGLFSLLILLFSPNKYAKQTIKYILIIGFIVSVTALY